MEGRRLKVAEGGVWTHRYTEGPGSRSGSRHTRHTAGLQTQSDRGTVPSPEHTATSSMTCMPP